MGSQSFLDFSNPWGVRDQVLWALNTKPIFLRVADLTFASVYFRGTRMRTMWLNLFGDIDPEKMEKALYKYT